MVALRPHLFGLFAGLCLAAGLVCSAILASGAWMRVQNSQLIGVKGSTRIVELGGLFTTQPPEFIYTKAGEARIAMLAEATKDARMRVGQIAAGGGGRVARLHDAETGIFQITPQYSGQTSWEGMNDTSSPEKTSPPL